MRIYMIDTAAGGGAFMQPLLKVECFVLLSSYPPFITLPPLPFTTTVEPPGYNEDHSTVMSSQELDITDQQIQDAEEGVPRVQAQADSDVLSLSELPHQTSQPATSSTRSRRKIFRITVAIDRKSTRLNSSHSGESRMPSSA